MRKLPESPQPRAQRGRLCAGLLALLTLAAGQAVAADAQVLRLVTTTTTDNAGLIAHLVPAFEAASGMRVHVIAVGTGRALRLLDRGDVDVALTHAHHLEQAAVVSGGAVSLQPVMYNDFVLVGPAADPAGTRRAIGIVDALTRIAKHDAVFVSRGDQSGTHVRELALWEAAGHRPSADSYREAGQGMGKTLQIAGELGAYTLVDRGTWLAYRDNLPLALSFQGDALLLNLYSVMSVNGERHPGANTRGARAFTEWILSPAAKAAIRGFLIDGHPLFVPVL